MWSGTLPTPPPEYDTSPGDPPGRENINVAKETGILTDTSRVQPQDDSIRRDKMVGKDVQFDNAVQAGLRSGDGKNPSSLIESSSTSAAVDLRLPSYSHSQFDTLVNRLKSLSVYAATSTPNPQQDVTLAPSGEDSQTKTENAQSTSHGDEPDPLDSQQQEISNPSRGTCTWIFDDSKFKSWETKSAPRVLLLLAGPGLGKTVLTKNVAIQLTKSADDPKVLAFFCKSKTSDRESAISIIATFLYRLLLENRIEILVGDSDARATKSSVLSRYLVDGSLTSLEALTFDDLWLLFLELSARSFGDQYVFIIDALDECTREARMELRRALLSLNDRLHSRLLISARPGGTLWGLEDKFPTIQVLPSTLEQDLTNFVLHDLEDRILLGLGNLDFQQLVLSKVREGAEGMFLILSCRLNEIHAHLLLDELQTTPAYIAEVLNKPFRPLLQFFANMLDNLTGSPKSQLGKDVLNIILAAQEPLLNEELIAAHVFSQSNFLTYQSYVNDSNTPKDLFYEVRSLCGSLIRERPELKTKKTTMSLVHDMAREVLDGDGEGPFSDSQKLFLQDISSEEGHVKMSKACLRYLLLPEMAEFTKESFAKYPFLLYALVYWPLHVAKSGPRLSEFAEILSQFYTSKAVGYFSWASWWSRIKAHLQDKAFDANPQPIAFTIAEFDMLNVLQMISVTENSSAARFGTSVIDLNASYNDKGTAFFSSIVRANEKMARELIKKGVNTRIGDLNGVTPLHVAILQKSETLIRLCCEDGAITDADGGISSSDYTTTLEPPLFWVFELENEDARRVLRLLYSLGVHESVRSEDGRSMLHQAASTGRIDLVKLILESRLIDVDYECQDGITALILAAASEDALEVVKFLIQEGANPGKVSHEGHSALLESLRHKDTAIAEFLIQELHKRIPEALSHQDSVGWSALHYCAFHGHHEVMKYIIERDTDVDMKTNDGETPLFLAVQGARNHAAEILISAGANVNVCDNDDKSPLFVACREGELKLVKTLLAAGANSRAGHGSMTCLHIAAYNNYPSICECLICSRDPISDVDEIHDSTGWTPLFAAVSRSNFTVSKLLVTTGADLSIRSSVGQYALHLCCQHRKNPALFDLVFDKSDKTTVFQRRKDGFTPLLLAADSGFVHAIRRLLNDGAADPSVTLDNLDTPLMLAASSGNKDAVEIILNDSGCLPNARNKNGFTALHQAACYIPDFDTISKLATTVSYQSIKRSASSPIFLAVLWQNHAALEALLQLDTPVDSPSTVGCTPLFESVSCGNSKFGQILLKGGADANIASLNVLPYVAALDTPCSDLVLLLRPKDYSQLGRKLDTTMTNAVVDAAEYNLKEVKWLIEQGVDARATSVDGYTALHAAASRARAEVLEYLLDDPRMASLVDARTQLHGCTALAIAAAIRSPECVRILLVKGKADPKISDLLGFSALDYAYSHNIIKETMAETCSKEQVIAFVKKDRQKPAYFVQLLIMFITWHRSIDRSDRFAWILRCLIFDLVTQLLFYIDDEENAMTALEQRFPRKDQKFSGIICCAVCNVRKQTLGFICSTCPYLFFCPDCRDDDEKMEAIGCSSHKLLRVVRDSFLTRDSTHVNDKGQNEAEWLETLEKDYRDKYSAILEQNASSVLPTNPKDSLNGFPALYDVWKYPDNRSGLFKLYTEAGWTEVKEHLLVYPRDVTLTNENGDDLVMHVLREAISDELCLEQLRILRAEAFRILTRNGEETSVVLACWRKFQQSTTYLLEQFDPSFNELEDKSSSEALRTIISERWHQALVYVVERHFKWASRGSFGFLQKMDALDFSDETIVEFLENMSLETLPKPDNSDDEDMLLEGLLPLRESSLIYDLDQTYPDLRGKRPRLGQHALNCVHEPERPIEHETVTMERTVAQDVTSSTEHLEESSSEDDDSSADVPSGAKSPSLDSRSSSLSEKAAILCGFGGLGPSDKDKLAMQGGAETQEPTINIRYGTLTDEKTLYETSVETLLYAGNCLVSALWAAQKAEICCDAFTVLHGLHLPNSPPDTPIAKLSRIPFEIAIEFLDGIAEIELLYNADKLSLLSEPALSAANRIWEICSFKQMIRPADATLDQLDGCCELVQFLCLAFLSFLGGHSSKLPGSILQTEFPWTSLGGIWKEYSISARPRKLACLGDMLDENVIVFEEKGNGSDISKESPAENSQKLFVVASLQDVLEIWGPGRYIFKTEPDGAQTQIVAVILRHGVLSLTGETHHGYPSAHWYELDGDEDSSTSWVLPTKTGNKVLGIDLLTNKVKDFQDLLSFEASELLMIGGLAKNGRCGVDYEQTYREAVAKTKLRPLATDPSYFQLATDSVSGAAGQYVTLSKSKGRNLITCSSVKADIIKKFNASYSGIEKGNRKWNPDVFTLMSEPHGLIFSACTNFAMRVPLRVVLGTCFDSFHTVYIPEASSDAYTARWNKKMRKTKNRLLGMPPRPSEQNQGLSADERLKRYISQRLDPQMRLLVHAIILEIIEALQWSGVSRDKKHFKIAWPRPTKRTKGYIFPCSDVKDGWVRLLQDTALVATFAVVTEQCLMEERRHHHRCRNAGNEIAELNALSVLDTRIIPCEIARDRGEQLGEVCLLVANESRNSNTVTHMKLVCRVRDRGHRGIDLIVEAAGWLGAELYRLFPAYRSGFQESTADSETSQHRTTRVYITADREWMVVRR